MNVTPSKPTELWNASRLAWTSRPSASSGRFWSLGPEGWRACPLAMKTSLAGLGLLAAVSELYLDFGAGRIGSFEMAPFAPGLHVLHGTLLS